MTDPFRAFRQLERLLPGISPYHESPRTEKTLKIPSVYDVVNGEHLSIVGTFTYNPGTMKSQYRDTRQRVSDDLGELLGGLQALLLNKQRLEADSVLK